MSATARNAQQVLLDAQNPLDGELLAAPVLSPQLLRPIDEIKQASRKALEDLDTPGFRDPFPVNTLSPVPAVAGEIAPIAKSSGIASARVPSHVFALNAEEKKNEISNPALLVLNVGLAFEKKKTARFAELRTEIQQAKLKADSFLKVQSEAQKLSPDSKVHPISAELKTALDNLRAKGVDLIAPDAKEITLDQLISLKSTVASHLETLRTMEMQIPFMEAEKISSELKSIYDTLQKVLQLVDRLISRINSRTGR
jgi:hypothetical protein